MKVAEITQKHDLSGSPSTIHKQNGPASKKQSLETLKLWKKKKWLPKSQINPKLMCFLDTTPVSFQKKQLIKLFCLEVLKVLKQKIGTNLWARKVDMTMCLHTHTQHYWWKIFHHNMSTYYYISVLTAHSHKLTKICPCTCSYQKVPRIQP